MAWGDHSKSLPELISKININVPALGRIVAEKIGYYFPALAVLGFTT